MSDDQADTTGEHIPIENYEENEPDEDGSEMPPTRRRSRRTYMIGAIILVLLVVGGGLAALGTFGNPLVAAPSPTPTIVPGDNLFYIQETLPGTVTIDGQRTTNILNSEVQPPIDPNQYHPIRLSVGTHHVVWQTAPFKSLSCLVFIPSLTSGQPCSYASPVPLQSGMNAWLITFTPSFSNVSAAQQKALYQAIQKTLSVPQFSTAMYPGEHYLSTNDKGITQIATAAVALTATLHLHLDTDPSSPRSCVNGYGDICTNNGQNCLQLCILYSFESSWYVAALYYPTWTYTTTAGQVVAHNQPDTNSPLVGVDHSAIFEVIWDGKGWQVTNTSAFSQTNQSLSLLQEVGAGGTANPVCASFMGLTQSTSTYDSASGPDHVLLNWSFYVGNEPAAGCLGVAAASGNAPAYFLYRFGVLLAANSLAHQYFPSLPVADAYEQGIAQSIAAKIKS